MRPEVSLDFSTQFGPYRVPVAAFVGHKNSQVPLVDRVEPIKPIRAGRAASIAAC